MRKATSTNTRNRAILGESCLVHDALARLALRWKVPVLHAVSSGASSYGELRRTLPAVTDQMLGTRLRELVAEGLLLKVVDGAGSSPRYEMTASGHEVLLLMEDLCHWARRQQARSHQHTNP